MSLQHRDDALEKRSRMAKALVKDEGFSDVYVLDRRSARQVLTEKRLELLEHVRDEDVESVRGLADALDRDKADVSRDVNLLVDAGVLTLLGDSNRKVPRLSHDTVVVEPIL